MAACLAIVGDTDEEGLVTDALRGVQNGREGDHAYLHDDNPAVRARGLRSGVGTVAGCRVERASPQGEDAAKAGARCWKIIRLPDFTPPQP
jgi:hypothetical protein